MKIFFSPYQLHPARGLNARTVQSARLGALLKVEWPEEALIGYADLCPFPELDDVYLKPELKALKEQRPSVLGRQSLWMARRDAEARLAKKNLLGDQPGLRNNFLISDVADFDAQHLENIREMGFRTVKIKCGRDLAAEAEWLNETVLSGLRLRLDFNSSVSAEEALKFQRQVSPAVDAQLDYVEDPCAYDPNSWQQIRERWRLALDRELDRAGDLKTEKPAADVLIVKPARQEIAPLVALARQWDLGLTVTSMMDHAVGGLHAFVCAQELRAQEGDRVGEAGCLTLRLDPGNEFSRNVRVEGPFILPAQGVGIGFDELLVRQNWMPMDKV